MMTHQTHSGFQLPRRVAGVLCFYLSVASIASAIGVVISVLVLTAPTRTASFDSIPKLHWSQP